MLKRLLSGLCVGAADIVPGISGGTVAFIIGIYEELLQAISSANLKLLCTLQFRAFFRELRWQFLLPFIAGVAISFLSLAKAIQHCLLDENLRPLLYSAFMGLVVGSSIFLARLMNGFTIKSALTLCCGVVAAFLLTDPNVTPKGEEGSLNSLWIVLCGAMAISAMLLPGISGSYILNILGVYEQILHALLRFVHHLKLGEFDLSSFRIVGCMAVGIVLGAVCFARIIKFLFNRYRQETIALLVGFMLGALRSVWPFWSYAFEPNLRPVSPILPDVASVAFMYAALFFAMGVASVFAIEHMAKRRGACD